MQTPVQWGINQTTTMTIACIQDNKKALDLTGLVTANLQLIIHPVAGGSDVVGAGTFTIVTPPSAGIVQYAPVANDFATAGSFNVFVVATFASNITTPSDPIPFNVVAR